jgi:hypothetical protein
MIKVYAIPLLLASAFPLSAATILFESAPYFREADSPLHPGNPDRIAPPPNFPIPAAMGQGEWGMD